MNVRWELRGQVSRDLLNEAILHVDISMEGLVIVHDPAAFDQKPVALLSQCQNGVQGLKRSRHNIVIQYNATTPVCNSKRAQKSVVLLWAC